MMDLDSNDLLPHALLIEATPDTHRLKLCETTQEHSTRVTVKLSNIENLVCITS